MSESETTSHNDAESSKDSDPLVGQVIGGHYEIICKLGSGGMGSVYKAKHLLLNRLAAVKVLSKLDERAVLRFQQEAKAAGHLQHTNIAAVHEFGLDENGNPYLVMDFVDGVPLSEVIAKEGRLSTDRVISIALRICDGLAHAHNNGVIHRDIKPANIMLCQSGDIQLIKIIDFGIAKILMEGQNLTQTGEAVGSPLYMSPEQCRGEKLNAQSDIYSFGCLLYQALTGTCPFEGDNAFKTLMMHINERPSTFKSIDKSLKIPRGLEEIVRRMLEKDRRARYQRVEDLQSDLERVRADKTVTLKPIYNFAFAKRVWEKGLVAFLVVLVAISAWQALSVKKKTWELRVDYALNERNANNYERARFLFDQALKEARAAHAPQDKIAKIFRVTGETEFDLGKKQKNDQRQFTKAKEHFEEGLKAVEPGALTNGANADQKAFLLFDLGRFYFWQATLLDAAKNKVEVMSLYQKATQYFQSALVAKGNAPETERPEFPERLNRVLLGIALRYTGRLAEAEKTLQDVIAAYENDPTFQKEGKLGVQYSNYLWAVLSLGKVQRQEEKYKDAIATYSKADTLSDGAYLKDAQFKEELTKMRAALERKLKKAEATDKS